MILQFPARQPQPDPLWDLNQHAVKSGVVDETKRYLMSCYVQLLNDRPDWQRCQNLAASLAAIFRAMHAAEEASLRRQHADDVERAELD